MASTDRGRVAIIRETVCGTTPTNPDFQVIRTTGDTLAYTKGTVESAEIDSRVQPSDTLKVGATLGGNVSFELSGESYDSLLEAAFRGTYDAEINATGVFTITKSTRTIVSSGAAIDAFEDAVVGQWVLLTGFVVGASYVGATDSPNNGWWEIETVTDDNTIVVRDPGAKLVNETSAVTASARSKRLLNGDSEYCHSIERGFLDVGAYMLFKGMKINGMSLNVSAKQIVTGEFMFMGSGFAESTADPVPWLGSGEYTAPTLTPAMTATTDVGQILLDNAISTACFRSITLSLTHNMREIDCIGQEYPVIEYGTPALTGSLERLFADMTLFRAMRDHDRVSLEFGFVAADQSSGVHFSLPSVTIDTDTLDLSGGKNSDVFDRANFSAHRYTNAADETYYVQVCVA